jgi:hypothetical protein
MNTVQQKPYTTQLQAGLAMLQETRDLLRIYVPGQTASQLSELALEQNVFPRTTARRAHNIVAEMFAPRYLIESGRPATELQFLLQKGLYPDDFNQLCFLFTARAQTILGEFISQSYWPAVLQGSAQIERSLAEDFVIRGLDSGRMQKRWTASTIKRVSAYILGCLVDFQLLQKPKGNFYPVSRFAIRRKVSIYLAHDLHFAGVPNSILSEHPDWSLFGMSPLEVRRMLSGGLLDDHAIYQYGAGLADISWRHNNMNSLLNELT